MTEASQNKKRRYPSFYEKTVPVAIGILVVVIAGMLILTIGIALGIFIP
jgi:hypothetical protein